MTVHQPEGQPIHLPPEAPIGTGERIPKQSAGVVCSCPDRPWCTGPLGPHWLNCARSCRSCHLPPKRKRRIATDQVIGELEAGP